MYIHIQIESFIHTGRFRHIDRYRNVYTKRHIQIYRHTDLKSYIDMYRYRYIIYIQTDVDKKTYIKKISVYLFFF